MRGEQPWRNLRSRGRCINWTRKERLRAKRGAAPGRPNAVPRRASVLPPCGETRVLQRTARGGAETPIEPRGFAVGSVRAGVRPPDGGEVPIGVQTTPLPRWLLRRVNPSPRSFGSGGSVTSREAQAAAQSSSGAGAAEAGGLDEPELRQTEGARALPGGGVRRSRSDLRRQRAGAARSWSGRWPRLPWGVDPSGSRWPAVARQQQKRIEGTGRWRMPKPPGSAMGAALRKARGT
ncbi:hypothetical protein Q9966_010021 [Columba livia]|nr:hypothetical protein Q9966_010021 [Columba livia]